MSSLLRIELGKALKNKWFIAMLVMGCSIALASALSNALTDFVRQQQNLQFMQVSYGGFSALSLYHFWIVTDWIQPATDLFFLLVPLLAVLPYAWSLASELKSGSIRNVLTRTGRSYYLCAKFGAAFVAGALAVGIPVVFNFIVCACIMPAYVPDIDSVLYLGIAEGSLWSQFFYSSPLLYSALMTLSNLLFGGLWACFVMSLALFIKNRIALLFGPYLVLIFVKFFESRVFTLNDHFGLTPFSYLRGVGVLFVSNAWVVFGEYLALFIVVCLIAAVLKRKDIL